MHVQHKSGIKSCAQQWICLHVSPIQAEIFGDIWWPGGQSHRKLPSVLMQVPPRQRRGLRWHSSMSAERREFISVWAQHHHSGILSITIICYPSQHHLLHGLWSYPSHNSAVSYPSHHSAVKTILFKRINQKRLLLTSKFKIISHLVKWRSWG